MEKGLRHTRNTIKVASIFRRIGYTFLLPMALLAVVILDAGLWISEWFSDRKPHFGAVLKLVINFPSSPEQVSGLIVDQLYGENRNRHLMHWIDSEVACNSPEGETVAELNDRLDKLSFLVTLICAAIVFGCLLATALALMLTVMPYVGLILLSVTVGVFIAGVGFFGLGTSLKWIAVMYANSRYEAIWEKHYELHPQEVEEAAWTDVSSLDDQATLRAFKDISPDLPRWQRLYRIQIHQKLGQKADVGSTPAILTNLKKPEYTLFEQSLDLQLCNASRTGNADECVRLLKAGANPSFVHEQHQCSAIHLAAFAGHANVLKAFFEFGGIELLRQKTLNKASLVFIACDKGHSNIIQMLQKCGFSGTDFDEIAIPKFCATVAHLAAGKGHSSVLTSLKDAGANLSLKDIEGLSAYDLFHKLHRPSMMQGLVDGGLVSIVREDELSESHRLAMACGFV